MADFLEGLFCPPVFVLIFVLPAIAEQEPKQDANDIHAIRNLLHRYAMFIDDARQYHTRSTPYQGWIGWPIHHYGNLGF